MSKQQENDEKSSLGYIPTSIETVFELLDKKLVSLGIPGALIGVGISALAQETPNWIMAIGCFVGAIAVWFSIKIGKVLSPRLDIMLDQSLDVATEFLGNRWSEMRSDFESQYLQQQVDRVSESTTEGYNPSTAIPLLEDVFVPLELGREFIGNTLGLTETFAVREPKSDEAELLSENLDIWTLLKRSRRDRQFREMVIQAKGGLGKTTLLKHITLIYGQRKYRRYGAPRFIPVLLQLRHWSPLLSQDNPPSLPRLITEYYLKQLSVNHPLTAPRHWAEN
ncbi:MAG: hypothetical protein F6K30_27225, partial [Cyanothece sp. SIO2G6]|nr:hypothetical protein [Cyanothece sp. SIO2G6]